MYGEQAGTALTQPERVTISGVHQETLKTLHESITAADALLVKVEGPKPQDKGEATPMPSRSVRNDAYELRDLALRVHERLVRLHNELGYDK